MLSPFAESLCLKHPALALYYAQEEPTDAKSFKKKTKQENWGCAMFLLAQALSGKTVAFSTETCHCPGAAEGMGLGKASYETFPAGVQGFNYFLSSGNKNWEKGRQVGKELEENGAPKDILEMFVNGERLKKTPELVQDFNDCIDDHTPKGPVVILEPLSKVAPGITPEVVIFMVDAVQLSALVTMANFARKGLDSVRIPFGSACMSLGALPLYEAKQEMPKAIVGLMDIAVRERVNKVLGRNLMSFAVPWKLFQEMENNLEESFLRQGTWQKLCDDKEGV